MACVCAGVFIKKGTKVLTFLLGGVFGSTAGTILASQKSLIILMKTIWL